MISLPGSDNNIVKRAVKGIAKKSVVLVLSLILVLGFAGCGSLEEAAQKAEPYIPKGYSLVHIEQVSKDSGVVFYTDERDLSVGIFVKNSFGWDWIGSGVGKLVTYPEGLQWRYADLVDKEKNTYSLYYGKVANNDIVRITVKTINGEAVEGTIADTEQLRLWYAFVNEPQVPSVNADITGYSNEDKVIYLFSQLKE